MKHLRILLPAAVLLAALFAGCAAPAGETAPTPSPEPVATSVPAETPDPSDSGTETGSQESIPPAAGSYAYTDPDDGTAWTLTLRENGTFTLREDREDGTSALHTGEELGRQSRRLRYLRSHGHLAGLVFLQRRLLHLDGGYRRDVSAGASGGLR